jgi:hypothetical protein
VPVYVYGSASSRALGLALLLLALRLESLREMVGRISGVCLVGIFDGQVSG